MPFPDTNTAEKHFVFCALCNGGELLDSWDALKQWSANHARREHNKYSRNADNAVRSLTIIYEKDADGVEQDPAHTDPTGCAMIALSWMQENGHL